MMLYDLIQQLKEKKLFTRLLVLSALFLLIILIVNLANKEKFDQQTLHDTNLNADQNHGYLSEDSVFAYNGMSFFKASTTENKVTILNSGLKLPVIKQIFWSNDSGALLTFDSSFTYTLVEKELSKMGKKLDKETQMYVWYLNFETSELSLVSKIPLRYNSATYSEQKNGFFYMPDNQAYVNEFEESELDASESPLLFYDISKKTNDSISKNTGLTAVDKISDCTSIFESGQVCIIARKTIDPSVQVFALIKSDGSVTMQHETYGQLYSTNKPGTIVEVESEKLTGNNIDSIETEFEEEEVVLRDVKNNSRINLGLKATNPNITTHFSNNEDFYMLLSQPGASGESKNDTKNSRYIVGRIKNIKKAKIGDSSLKMTDNLSVTTGFLSLSSHGGGDKTLLTSFAKNQYIFTSIKPGNSFDVSDSARTLQAIKLCVAQTSKNAEVQFFESSKTYRIIMVDDNDRQKNQTKVADCINSNETITAIGNNYQYSVKDSFNGRLVSD